MSRRVRVVDSHSEGQPTRVVLERGPELGSGTAADRLERLRREHDAFRSAVVNEPRGYDALVGALLGAPSNDSAVAQVIFFNNVGYLGMCVHGTMGVAATLAWLGRIEPGLHRLETPVGDVEIRLEPDGRVAVWNVPSYRYSAAVTVRTPSYGEVTGDVAWGGNWFFLAADHGQRLGLDRLAALTDYCQEVRAALGATGITGDDGAEIDHVELFGPPVCANADSRNFVLCPGREYDRSPCGTGTSAKLACLHADGKLEVGQDWRQESIIGSLFTARLEERGARLLPRLEARAWVTAESDLVILDDDPFGSGIVVR